MSDDPCVIIPQSGRRLYVGYGSVVLVEQWTEETPQAPKYSFGFERRVGPSDNLFVGGQVDADCGVSELA